jgi:hypothetical protein
MRQKSGPEKQPAEDAIRDIRRATRRHFSAEEKIRVVLEGLRGEETVCDCLSFDPFAFEEDGLGSSEVDVGRREIAQALVIAGMVVMSHEGGDLTFEIAGQVIVLEQDAVLERLMPALDLALVCG